MKTIIEMLNLYNITPDKKIDENTKYGINEFPFFIYIKEDNNKDNVKKEIEINKNYYWPQG